MNICLYGASSDAIAPDYITATEALGEHLARHGHSLVYRGGGHIVGVVPSFLRVDGILYDRCDEMVYTDTMRERKQVMEERADAFIVTPGGIGTYEEFFEIYTLKQLGRHGKPIVIYNIGGYYDQLLAMLEHTVAQGFMRPASLELYMVAENPSQALAQMCAGCETVDIRRTKFVKE